MLPSTINALLAATGVATACAILSPFVIARRWAFLGEGISHSGFGGAGTAWILASVFPALRSSTSWTYSCVILFSFLAALAIGWLVRRPRLPSDSAIGIFLVASLAWGFIGQQTYFETYHQVPAGFYNLLTGQLEPVSLEYAIASCVIALGIGTLVWLLHKELTAYCLDPELARASGVRTTFIHYLLLILLVAAIVTGIRVVGNLLVTALLVLPAATANLVSRRLAMINVLSILVALLGAWGGLAASTLSRALPAGACIVLVMVVVFLIALILRPLIAAAPRMRGGQRA